MTGSEYDHKTIDGYPVVRSCPGEFTGEERLITSDGRVWDRLQAGVPNTLPTGVIIRQIRDAR